MVLVDIGSLNLIDFFYFPSHLIRGWNGVFLRIFVIWGGHYKMLLKINIVKKNAIWRHTLLPPSLPPTIKHKINDNSNYN